jgi:UPF0755 protein
MKYRIDKRRAGRDRLIRIVCIAAVILVVGGAGAIYVRQSNERQLRPVSNTLTLNYFTVEKGMTAKEIASKLKDAGLIRSASAFEWYVRNQEVRDKLKAGTYTFNPAMSTKEIVKKMVDGDVTKNILTILPEKRLDQIKQVFIEEGYTKEAVDAAFDPAQYRDLPALASLPAGASLEGYLYPDSFEKTTDTPASTIIQASLAEMAKNLTPDRQAGFARHGLSIFQAITLASIVEKEAPNSTDRPKVAQVFLTRLNQGIVLGSDVTAFYASDIAGKKPSVLIDSPYNTRIYKGLPPGPIGTITNSSLDAVANPASTDFLYFVAGDDGTIHYSHTQAEHEALTKKYCTVLCGQ